MKAAVDNDVLFKSACFGVLNQLPAAMSAESSECGVLGAARFVLRKKIRGYKLRQDANEVTGRLNRFLTSATTLEPDEKEKKFAAQLESSALQLGLNLDAGESQLCAIVLSRAIPILLTGDKRAIGALEQILESDAILGGLSSRVMCLEQLFLRILELIGFAPLRSAVCGEPEVDKALRICFGCHKQDSTEMDIQQGLNSYIGDLRSVSTRLLS